MLEMLVDESLKMIVDESLDMIEDESLMVEDKSLEKLMDETLKLDEEHFKYLTTGRLINGSSCGGIDMVRKDLNLEPNINARMRTFWILPGVSFPYLQHQGQVSPLVLENPLDVGLDPRTEVHGMSIHFSPTEWCRIAEAPHCSHRGAHSVSVALIARASLSQLDPNAVVKVLTTSFVRPDAVAYNCVAVSCHCGINIKGEMVVQGGDETDMCVCLLPSPRGNR
ncbi:hypothetical protein Tco_0340683 [Tanacetum coccineum]